MTPPRRGVDRPSEGDGRLTPVEEVRFWLQVIVDSRKTILCRPADEPRVRGIVDRYGVGGFITVEASNYIPAGQMRVVDTDALDAARQLAVKQLRGERR